MRLRPTFALPLFALALAACDSSDPDPVLLRVENASALDFSSVVVGFPEADANYGAVAAGQASDYLEFETAYRYGAITAEAAGETYRLVPFDFVGEEPLAAGRYTYVLTVDGSNIELELETE